MAKRCGGVPIAGTKWAVRKVRDPNNDRYPEPVFYVYTAPGRHFGKGFDTAAEARAWAKRKAGGSDLFGRPYQ